MIVDISDLLTHIDDLLRSGGGGVFFNHFFWICFRSYFNSNPGNICCQVHARRLSVTQKSYFQKWK